MKKSKVQKPFFSKLLEAQKIDDTQKLKGGKNDVTMKAPSDNDET